MSRVLEMVLRREVVELHRHQTPAVKLPQEGMLCCRSAWHSIGKVETTLVAVLGDSGGWIVWIDGML